MDIGARIAGQVLKSIGAQIDLLFTLSVAICGGVIWLIVQLAVHNNAESTKTIRLEWPCLLTVTFVLEGLAIFFGYLARSAVTASIPAIFRADYTGILDFGNLQFQGHTLLKYALILQFLTFLAGIACLLIILLKNKKIFSGG